MKIEERPLRVAIIGGGPGGLVTAYLLRNRTAGPLDITLFEASQRLGGKIVTARFDTGGIPYEAGAAELYDYSMTGPDPLRELVRELGLSTRPLQGRTVILDGRFLKTDQDIAHYLGPKALAALQDFRREARRLISPAEYYDSDWREDNQDPLARQRFSELLQTVPDEHARKYIRVAVHSDLATEPHRTSAMYGLQNFLMNESGYMNLYTIDGGIESLTRELAARIHDRVLLGHRVSHVEHTAEGTYTVIARHPEGSFRETFDLVVVALPNNWIPSIEWRGHGLAAAMHAHHRHYDYPAHYLRASLLFQRPFWRDCMDESYFMLDAFGGCCVYDESSRGGGGEYGVLGWLLAGEAAVNLSNFPDGEIVEQILDTLPPCWQAGRELLLEGRVHRWVGSVNGWPAGFPAREPDSRHQPDPKGNSELFVVGDYLFDSTLNGVLDSADIVAEWIRDLQKEWDEPVSA